MKIIFLDIDGVLNSKQYQSSSRYSKKQGQLFNPCGYTDNRLIFEATQLFYHIDEVAVEVLNTIIELTDAKIVISSSWRHNFYNIIVDNLSHMGFNGMIIGHIPFYSVEPEVDREMMRGFEIKKWLKLHSNGDPYLILDDDPDGTSNILYEQRFNFIKTTPQFGLMASHIDEALKILNGDI